MAFPAGKRQGLASSNRRDETKCGIIIHIYLISVHPALWHGGGARNPVPLPVSQMQGLVFADSFPHVLYKIIPTALAGMLRVLSIDDLVAGSPESWCSSACACVWHIAQSFCTLDPHLTGRQNSMASLHQAVLHMATENLKSSDALVKEDVKSFCYSKSCVC